MNEDEGKNEFKSSLELLGLTPEVPRIRAVYKTTHRNTNRKGMKYWQEFRKSLYDYGWTILRLSCVGTWRDEDEAKLNIELLRWYIEGPVVLDKEGEPVVDDKGECIRDRNSPTRLYRVLNFLQQVVQISATQKTKNAIYNLYNEVTEKFKVAQKQGRAIEEGNDFLLIDAYIDLPAREKRRIINRIRTATSIDDLFGVLDEEKEEINEYL